MNRLEISDMQFVKRRNIRYAPGRMLRFTLTWVAGTDDDPRAVSMAGCIAAKSRDNSRLTWSPPTFSMDGGKKISMVTVNERLYQDVLKAIQESKYERYIESYVPKAMLPEAPHSIDPTLPLTIAVTMNTEAQSGRETPEGSDQMGAGL